MQYKKIQSFFLILFIISFKAFSEPRFHCETDFPIKLQVDSLKSCNQKTISTKLQPGMPGFDATLTDLVMHHNNLGGSIINFPNQSKIVYRSANLASAPLCLQELHESRKVDTIINLLDRPIGHQYQQNILEESIFESLGGAAYMQIFNISFEPQTKITNDYYDNVSNVINFIKYAKGNVLIHCLAGEHATGVIFGVMQKCYNKLPIDVIKKNAICHLGQAQTQYMQDMANLAIKIIEDYPCSILST